MRKISLILKPYRCEQRGKGNVGGGVGGVKWL